VVRTRYCGAMPVIRPALAMDLPGAYRVCLLTGDSGRDASAQFRNPDLLGHVYVGPYVTGEPDLALVVADGEGVAGYCLAVANTRAFERWCEASWWPTLRAQYPLPADATPDGELVGLIHAPAPAPEAVLRDYPAHLHIDLLERTRGLGLGRALVERQLTALRDRGVPGLYLDVARDNANAIAFYDHLGFAAVHELDRSILMARRLA
jgi:ribosomal protein S18 acetylase RimI-like enzyme